MTSALSLPLKDVGSDGGGAGAADASTADGAASIKSEELSGARDPGSLNSGLDVRFTCDELDDLDAATLRTDGGLFGTTAFNVPLIGRGGRSFREEGGALSSEGGPWPSCCGGLSASPINQGS